MDKAHDDVCSPAICHLLQRAYQVYGDTRYECLARLSVSHLYNLRKSASYRTLRIQFATTSAARNSIGVRKKPRPKGRVGFVRIDTVHQRLSTWCGAGGWLLNAMSTVASETYTSTSAPIQYAAIRAFEGGTEMKNYLAHSRRILRHLGRHVWRALRNAGAEVSEPVGGFYLFPDFSPLRKRLTRHGITSSVILCERLLDETGVATLPGADFGRPPVELTLRLAYVDFDGARTLSAAQQIPLDQELDRTFLELYCPNVTQAATVMSQWLKKMK